MVRRWALTCPSQELEPSKNRCFGIRRLEATQAGNRSDMQGPTRRGLGVGPVPCNGRRDCARLGLVAIAVLFDLSGQF